MPIFRALRTRDLPAGVLGGRRVEVGEVIGVNEEEALLLAEEAGDFMPLTAAVPFRGRGGRAGQQAFAPELNRMIAAADNTKQATAEEPTPDE